MAHQVLPNRFSESCQHAARHCYQQTTDLQDWRLKIRRYNLKMGRAIESDVKVVVLLSNAEEDIRKQLQQEADREQETFDALAKRIDIVLQLPSFHSRPGPNRERQTKAGATMEVDGENVSFKRKQGKDKGKAKPKKGAGEQTTRQRIARFSADTADFVECMARNSYIADRNSTQNITEGDQCSPPQ